MLVTWGIEMLLFTTSLQPSAIIMVSTIPSNSINKNLITWCSPLPFHRLKKLCYFISKRLMCVLPELIPLCTNCLTTSERMKACVWFDNVASMAGNVIIDIFPLWSNASSSSLILVACRSLFSILVRYRFISLHNFQ